MQEKWNREVGAPFNPRRGIRQADPFVPYLLFVWSASHKSLEKHLMREGVNRFI